MDFFAKQQKVLKMEHVAASGIKLYQFVDLCAFLFLLAGCKI